MIYFFLYIIILHNMFIYFLNTNPDIAQAISPKSEAFDQKLGSCHPSSPRYQGVVLRP